MASAHREQHRPVDGGTTSLIGLRGVSRVYGSGEAAVHALSAVDLEVAAGEFVVVLGPSGSGKTTLNAIGALERPVTRTRPAERL